MALLTVLSYLPIALLVWLMTKRRSVPVARALPMVAVVTYLIVLIVFERDPNQVHAAVLDGLLTAWTPISIIAGAILLFRTMEATGAMDTIRVWLNSITPNPIAQLMIVGWAFPFLIEGASGFGTPAALAAPILVGLGFPPVQIAIMVLVMNSVPVSFGAVGTPTWFGFSELSLSQAEILEIGTKTAIVHGFAALVIPIVALLFVVRPREILRNGAYIYLSILATVVPYVLLATVSPEFPALVGGAVGLMLSVLFAKLGWGLRGSHTPTVTPEDAATVAPRGKLIKAGFPLWGTIAVLVLTRIRQLGLQSLLRLREPRLQLDLGSLGTGGVSAALRLSLEGIFGTEQQWAHELLYMPSIVPFGVVALVTFCLFGSDRAVIRRALLQCAEQVAAPTKALLGALVFVNLMLTGGDTSGVALIGSSLAAVTGAAWQFVAPLLGALGTFFSGSSTVSNLTFGAVQDSIARELGLNRTTILALQSAGGGMGTMIGINSIVAVCSVLALPASEGYILKRTVLALAVYLALAAVIALMLP